MAENNLQIMNLTKLMPSLDLKVTRCSFIVRLCTGRAKCHLLFLTPPCRVKACLFGSSRSTPPRRKVKEHSSASPESCSC